TKEASISIIDYLGRCILSHKINNGTVENNTINIASLPKGIYILQIENDGATSMTKFVRE
ncbi:MAG: T9SS type A sorting domain-containing protein, partial [Chitinophagales bacterium]|nr:T9SS type A sorting domain-containing protein [Chitinophagales bacterium]